MVHDCAVMYQNLLSSSGLSLERLQTFARIVEAGGITAAAHGDPNKQSQFSRQLKELEEFFAAELLKRGRGQFALTTAGRALHELVRTQLSALDELKRSCASQPVELAFGAGESLLQWLVLPRLPRVREQLPGVRWTLQNLQTAEIIARLVDARTDLGLVRRDAVPKSLRSLAVGTMEFAFFVPKIAQRPRASCPVTQLLTQLPLVILEGHSRLTEALNDAARQARASLNVQLCCSSLTQAAEAVRQLGVAAILPTFAKTAFDAADVEVLPMPFLKATSRPLVLAWNPRVARLRPVLTKAVRQMPALLAWE